MTSHQEVFPSHDPHERRDKTPSVNGQAISHPTKLSAGDVIVVAGVELEFVYRK